MPTDIALHPLGTPIAGQLLPSPAIPVLNYQIRLPEGINSNVFTVTGSPAILVLVATAKLRLDIRANANVAALNTEDSGLVLNANERVSFVLPQGDWVLKTALFT